MFIMTLLVARLQTEWQLKNTNSMFLCTKIAYSIKTTDWPDLLCSTNKLCRKPPQYTTAPCKLTFDLLTSRTWSLTLRWLVKVTPSTLIDVTRRISCNVGGAVNCGLRLQSVKTISTDLALLSFKLLACAQSATRSEVNKHGTILGPLRLFAKHVTATTLHKSVGHRYVTFILAVCCSSDATGLYILRRYLTNTQSNLSITRNMKQYL